MCRCAAGAGALLALLLPADGARATLAPPQDSGAEVLARYAAALDDTTTRVAAGDVELLGRVEGARGTRQWRMLLRLDPPSMREELSDGATPAGAATSALVSSAHRAWGVPGSSGADGADAEPGASVPFPRELPVGVSVAITDRLNELRLMLQPQRFTESVSVDASSTELPATPGWPSAGETVPADVAPGRAVTSLLLANPAALVVRAHFDRETGLLIGLDQPWTITRPWVRLSDWRSAGGLRLPMRRIQGSEAFPAVTTLIEEVRAGLSVPDELFAGDPYVPRRSAAEIAGLRIVPSTVPGTGYITLQDVRANGQPAAALFDTAADGVFLHPALLQSLGVGMFATRESQALFASTTTSVHHLALLEIGIERLHQLPAFGSEIPRLAEFQSSQQPRIVIGGWPIMQFNPVLDLRNGRLVSRGPQPAPLPPRGTRFEIPLGGSADERGVHYFDIEVSSGKRVAQVLLDTGMPYLLRLSASGMRRLGLPTTREFWAERGGAVMPLAGAGGQVGADLLVRVRELYVGPITYQAPYVLLAGLGDSPEALDFPWDGLLGAGALLPFDRAGFDGVRGVLEVEVSSAAEVGDTAAGGSANGRVIRTPSGFPAARLVAGGTRVVVGDPGVMTGFFLRTNDPDDGGTPPLLPSVFAVQPRSPAARAGIRVGDRLARIDGASIAGMPLAEITPALWLDTGEHVTLSFARSAAGDASGKIEWIDVTLP